MRCCQIWREPSARTEGAPIPRTLIDFIGMSQKERSAHPRSLRRRIEASETILKVALLHYYMGATPSLPARTGPCASAYLVVERETVPVKRCIPSRSSPLACLPVLGSRSTNNELLEVIGIIVRHTCG